MVQFVARELVRQEGRGRLVAFVETRRGGSCREWSGSFVFLANLVFFRNAFLLSLLLSLYSQKLQDSFYSRIPERKPLLVALTTQPESLATAVSQIV